VKTATALVLRPRTMARFDSLRRKAKHIAIGSVAGVQAALRTVQAAPDAQDVNCRNAARHRTGSGLSA
jgi:hypothetical protein